MGEHWYSLLAPCCFAVPLSCVIPYEGAEASGESLIFGAPGVGEFRGLVRIQGAGVCRNVQ